MVYRQHRNRENKCKNRQQTKVNLNCWNCNSWVQRIKRKRKLITANPNSTTNSGASVAVVMDAKRKNIAAMNLQDVTAISWLLLRICKLFPMENTREMRMNPSRKCFISSALKFIANCGMDGSSPWPQSGFGVRMRIHSNSRCVKNYVRSRFFSCFRNRNPRNWILISVINTIIYIN